VSKQKKREREKKTGGDENEISHHQVDELREKIRGSAAGGKNEAKPSSLYKALSLTSPS